MPYKIHETAAKRQMFWNISRPQEIVQKEIPENWSGTAGQGLPVVEIPFYAYPCVIYKHPRRPFQEIEHRNDRMELIHTEIQPTEHIARSVSCEAHKNGGGLKDCLDCNKALELAMEDGWVKEPYIPAAPEKKDADLYGSVRSKSEKKETRQ